MAPVGFSIYDVSVAVVAKVVEALEFSGRGGHLGFASADVALRGAVTVVSWTNIPIAVNSIVSGCPVFSALSVRWKELGDERKLVFVDIVISPRLPEGPVSIRVSYECDYNLWYKCEYHEKPVPEEVEHAGP